jgi:LmbE family N-acetylglucosaminyl deacetylase
LKIVYFSPHLDDAIFSCGGIIARQVKGHFQVAIWSFFTADPPADNLTYFARILHHRWGKQGSPYRQRREEDIEACSLLSAEWKHFGFEDCIYRNYPSNNAPLVRKKADLFRPVKEPEAFLEDSLFKVILENLSPEDQIVLPLEAGGHIDHVLVKTIGDRLSNKKYYYPDFPYAGKLNLVDDLHLPPGADVNRFPLEPEEIDLWKKASATYRSQISSFWKSEKALEQGIDHFVASPIGCTLWSLPER